MRNSLICAAAAAITFMPAAAISGAWSLNPDLSRVSFGSIKNDYLGENHSFGDVSGAVSEDGQVTLDLALGSVDTLIEIRDERMIEHVFKNAPSATVTSQIDMAAMEGLAVGEAKTLETEGALAFLGQELDLDASFFVMRINEEQVLVTTNGMVMLSTEDAGIDAGIDALQEIAGLDSITRVSPVTMRLIFERDAG